MSSLVLESKNVQKSLSRICKALFCTPTKRLYWSTYNSHWKSTGSLTTDAINSFSILQIPKE